MKNRGLVGRVLDAGGSISYARCTILLSDGGECPLCGAEVKPNVVHECEQRPVKGKRVSS